MIKVVMYHYIRDHNTRSFPSVNGLSTRQFEDQILFFIKNFSVISIDDLFENEMFSLSTKDKVLLTFDDGYIDHYNTVLPILKKFGLRGAFYPVVKSSRDRLMLDVNRIHCLLSIDPSARKLMQYLDDLIIKHKSDYNLYPLDLYKSKHFSKNRWDSIERSYLKKMLQHALPPKFKAFALKQLFSVFLNVTEKELADSFYMNTKQLKELVSEGMHVGGHSFQHNWLNKTPGDIARREIIKSAEYIDYIYDGCPLRTFCYPYGGYDEKVLSFLKEFDYKLAFTVAPGQWDGRSTPLTVPRYDTNDI